MTAAPKRGPDRTLQATRVRSENPRLEVLAIGDECDAILAFEYPQAVAVSVAVTLCQGACLILAREWAISCGGVKVILAILAILAMAVTAFAGSNDPGETAVHFLEKVRAKKLNLEPGGDTALSPQTSGQKRKEIARRLERLARDLGTDPLEVGAMKLDDDLAAVLVRKIGGFDPSRLQVFPVALVKRGTDWAAAPVPASFENSGVGYAAVLRQRLAALEDWMLREQAIDLLKLRDQSTERMRRKISASLPPETLRDFTSKQAAERFLTACERRDLPEIFGLLGGLAATLPNDWPLRLKAAEAAVATATEGKHPWRLLIAAEVLRILVHHEEDGDSLGLHRLSGSRRKPAALSAAADRTRPSRSLQVPGGIVAHRSARVIPAGWCQSRRRDC